MIAGVLGHRNAFEAIRARLETLTRCLLPGRTMVVRYAVNVLMGVRLPPWQLSMDSECAGSHPTLSRW